MSIISWLKNPGKIFTSSRRDTKGCGCKVFVPAGYEGIWEKNWPDTELIEEELTEEVKGRYRNCTYYQVYKQFKLKCTRCGKTYTTRKKHSTKTDYGEENPEAPTRLEFDCYAAPLLGRWSKKREEAVIEDE